MVCATLLCAQCTKANSKGKQLDTTNSARQDSLGRQRAGRRVGMICHVFLFTSSLSRCVLMSPRSILLIDATAGCPSKAATAPQQLKPHA